MKITKKSLLTGNTHTIELDVTQEQMDRFNNRRITGEYAQDIFPNLSTPEREFIISGITPEEWKKEFSI